MHDLREHPADGQSPGTPAGHEVDDALSGRAHDGEEDDYYEFHGQRS
jgi:hypothetical protein